MATKTELLARADELASKYNEEELKKALENALMLDDQSERLSLQRALQIVTNSTDGNHRFTKEAKVRIEEKTKRLP